MDFLALGLIQSKSKKTVTLQIFAFHLSAPLCQAFSPEHSSRWYTVEAAKIRSTQAQRRQLELMQREADGMDDDAGNEY